MFAREHLDEIGRVVNGGATGRDSVVQKSWLRCVNDYGLDPQRANSARIVTEATLRVHREQSQRLISIARNGLEKLFRLVVGQNYVLLLADAQGITVDFFGDPSFESELRQSGLYLGSDWSENVMGTCGVGVSIVTEKPVTIHQSDHFNTSHTPLSCTAAPIFDTSGNLAAVLDLSLLRPPQPKVTQNLALQLVKASVRRIEMANLMANCRTEWIMHISELPEHLDVDPDATIALDHSGRIVGVTGTAMRILKNNSVAGTQSNGNLIGQEIANFIEIDTNDLPNLTNASSVEERLIHMTNGLVLFGSIRPPSHNQPDAGGRKLPKRLVSLGYTDPVMIDVVNVAAKVADANAPILIRGETGVGKHRLASAIHDSRPFSEHFLVLDCAALEVWFTEQERLRSNSQTPEFETASPFDGTALDTLFLDEIADLSAVAQTKLLSLLKQYEMGHKMNDRQIKRRIKVLSSTSRDVDAMVKAGSFRSDLFFHLAATSLHLPPLRKRSDFSWLLDRLLKQRSIAYPRTYKLSTAARLELRQRPWPGNIRELINVLDIALTLTDSEIIDLEHLPPPVLSEAVDILTCRSLPEQAVDLETTLHICGWNVSRTARRLGVNRTTIHRRMERLGITRPN